MSIHASSSVDDDPVVSLESWSIRESNTGARHFVGFNLAERDGRVSTAIISFDPTTRTGVTVTGRRYVLVGRAGFDRDAEYVWQWAGETVAYSEVERRDRRVRAGLATTVAGRAAR